MISTTSKFYFVLIFSLIPVITWAWDNTDAEQRGSISGLVINKATGEPVSWATVYIDELKRGVTTHEDGRFRIPDIPFGRYEIVFQRVGYNSKVVDIEINSTEEREITIILAETVFRSEFVEITGSYNGDQTTEATQVISGRQLRQQLSRTISETLVNEPGLDQQSMGPAPSRPVLRGLGGERLLILEDGGRTGDLSATSADHALAIESMTAEAIELIRGPSALVYGSNTMAGVINVIRGQIPKSLPDHFHSSISTQMESVNKSITGGGFAHGPIGNVAYRLDLSYRNANDIQTPAGRLDNTNVETINGSLGLSYHRSWGYLGMSGNIYTTYYGIPGGFQGGHPNGVDIDMLRRYLEFEAGIESGFDWIRRHEFDATYAYYYHKEVEFPSRLDGRELLGSEFGVLTTNLRAQTHHNGFFGNSRGLFGVWAEHRDYASGGGVFTPSVIETGIAAYIYEDIRWDKIRLQTGLRYDLRNVNPEEFRGAELGNIRERSFGGISASAMLSYSFANNVQVGSSVMRSYRAPGIEELFSDGPHLAAFTFEVGNPDLDDESGLGVDIYAKYAGDRTRFQIAAFRNQFSNYIFTADTGERSRRRSDLNVFQYQGENVLMTGAETGMEFQVYRNWVTSATLSYVRGDIISGSMPFVLLDDSEQALPMISPFRYKFDLEYRRSDLNAGVALRGAMDQTRTGPFEEPTDGYVVFDIYSQYQFTINDRFHSISLSFENILDTEYRSHLSRIKSIMPEPGRNVKFLYRVYL